MQLTVWVCQLWPEAGLDGRGAGLVVCSVRHSLPLTPFDE